MQLHMANGGQRADKHRLSGFYLEVNTCKFTGDRIWEGRMGLSFAPLVLRSFYNRLGLVLSEAQALRAGGFNPTYLANISAWTFPTANRVGPHYVTELLT